MERQGSCLSLKETRDLFLGAGAEMLAAFDFSLERTGKPRVEEVEVTPEGIGLEIFLGGGMKVEMVEGFTDEDEEEVGRS
jgi:hypothetical protein